MSDASPLFVNVEEAAKLLSVSRATFYKLLSGGEVHAVKHGRRTLVPYEALVTFAASLQGRKLDD